MQGGGCICSREQVAAAGLKGGADTGAARWRAKCAVLVSGITFSKVRKWNPQSTPQRLTEKREVTSGGIALRTRYRG